MKKVELVDEALFLEEVDGAVDSDEMDFGADLLRAIQDLVDVQVLLGGIHDLEDDAALARETYAALAQSLLQMAGGVSRIDALAGRDATSRNGGHEEIVQRGERELKVGSRQFTVSEKRDPGEHQAACRERWISLRKDRAAIPPLRHGRNSPPLRPLGG